MMASTAKTFIGLLALSFGCFSLVRLSLKDEFIASIPVERELGLKYLKREQGPSNLNLMSMKLEDLQRTDGDLTVLQRMTEQPENVENERGLSFLQVMSLSVKYKDRALFPFSHSHGTLFDKHKLQARAEELWTLNPDIKLETNGLSGNTLQSAAQGFSSQIGVPKGFLSHFVTAGASFKVSNENRAYTTFAYSRTKKVVKTFRLYNGLSSQYANEKLRALLVDDIRQEIDKITTLEAANEFVENMGPAFILTGNFGVGFTLETTSEHVSFSTSREAKLFLEAKGTEFKASNMKQGVNSEDRATYWLSVIGGDIGKFNNDKEGWLASADDNDDLLQLVKYDLSPIYALAKTGSRTKQVLEAAYNTYVQENPLRDDYFDFNKKPIIEELKKVYDEMEHQKKEGKRRYGACWTLCNDMKNWYVSAENIMGVIRTLIDIVDKNLLHDTKVRYINEFNTRIKGRETCWGGFGCKDSTYWNKNYQDAERKLHSIYMNIK